VSYPPPPPQGPPPGQYPPQPPYGYGYGGYPPQQPYWTPPPRIDPKQLKPSRLWYWLSPIPVLIGTVIAVVLLVGVIKQFDTNLDHFAAPGAATERLDKGDERGIYLQTAGTAGARSNSGAVLSCSVRDSRERTVPLRDASALNLTINNDEYVEQWRFKAPADGTYIISCREPSGAPVAVGPHIAVRRFLGPILGMIVVFLVGLALTAIIAIVTGVKRSNHKQRLQREAQQAG
jgi:hypothetical protein